MIELITDRLRLRPHRADDFAESAAMWADPAVVRRISGVPSTAEEAWGRLLRYAGHWSLNGYGYFLVADKVTGAFLGEAGLADYKRDMVPPLGPMPEAGWVFRTAAHGCGYATEAVAAICAWADGALAAKCTACIMDPTHHASIRVAEKCGFAGDLVGSYRGEPTRIMIRQRRLPGVR